MSWRKIAFIVVALIVLLGGAAALSELFVSMKPEPPRKPDVELIRYVKAETVKYEEIISPVSREGRVTSSSEVVLVAEAAGKIEKGSVVLKKGASFKKGQLLAEIYKDEVELALKARKSGFLTTITTILPDLRVDFPEQYEKYYAFFNAINIDKEFPGLPESTDEKLKIFLASRNVLSEYYGILQDEKKLGRHSLYAPFNGTFTQVNFEVGGYVNTGNQIAKMIRTDELEIEVAVENHQSEWIKIGDKVNVSSGINDVIKLGSVVRKSAFIDENTQSRSFFIKVKNTGGEQLLKGEYMVVEFPGHKIDAAMEIPRSAIFNSNEVYTVVEGKLKKQEINILKWNEKTLIFNGIEEGEKIVVESLINVKENSPVGILGEEKPSNGNNKGQGKPKTQVKG